MSWFVVDARDADPPGERFEQLGFAIGVLQAGRPNALYRAESAQEDFLVHVFVGAGDDPTNAADNPYEGFPEDRPIDCPL